MADGVTAPHEVPACNDPVFVLCTSRSGSTLLRFVLDAHPDLACPPEMKLPFVLSQLARLWSATDGLGVAPGNSAPMISDAVAAGIRLTMDMMMGPYLARRGKSRYCDKNLGTEPHVETLLAVYPEAKFICLYRHPMDMIASGVEACPWGLNQYGFEPYVANAPGNSVLALARYWTDHIGAILAVEDRHPEHCHRVRYEDLVADPETVAAGIFGFLGLPPAPGISARAFSRDRERTGPGDFKIWNTSQISDDSVGRGWSVPADLIPAPLTATINNHIDRLGYVRIDANWGTVRKPSDLRLPAEGQAPAPRAAVRGGAIPAGALLLSERLQNGLHRADDEFIQEWQPHSDGPFLMVALAPAGTEDDAWWLVDLAARKVVSGSGNCTDDRGWTISAPAATWEQVIRDGLNLGIAFRRHGMRYRDQGGGGAGSTNADNRVSMMSDLLGIVTWNPDRADLGPPGSNGPLFESRPAGEAGTPDPGGPLVGRSRTEGPVLLEARVPVGTR
ncbi:MAG TPA: sulfotransferase, partial [Streptosporangiaceae bacterium]|nr:sulfotransferase [Streptosporangiaceae bacterium]